MRADLGALFDHDDGRVRRDLLEPDRGGEAGRTGADNDDVELHRLAGGKIRCIHGLLHSPMSSRHQRNDLAFANVPRIDLDDGPHIR